MTKDQYSEFLKRLEWKNKKEKILRRDWYTCKKCGYVGIEGDGDLHVHHLWYYGRPWDVPDTALVTLCNNCHKKIHKK